MARFFSVALLATGAFGLLLLSESMAASGKGRQGVVGSASGRVIHAITGRPVKGLMVVAESGIPDGVKMIKSTSTAVTNDEGAFVLKGLSLKTGYAVAARREGVESDSAYVYIQPNHRIIKLDKPLRVCEIPASDGVFYWDGQWRRFEIQLELFPHSVSISDRLNMSQNVRKFWHVPTKAGTSPSIRKFAAGTPSIVGSIEGSNRVPTRLTIAVKGPESYHYLIYPFYFWPAFALSGCPDKPEACGLVEFPEGYYLGVRTLSSKLMEKSLLVQMAGGPANYSDIEVQYESTPLYEVCTEKVAGQNAFAYGSVELRGGAFFVIAPSMSSDGNRNYGALIQPVDHGSAKASDTHSFAMKSSCREKKWDELLGIYFYLHRPMLDFAIDNIYDSMNGLIERNRYYNNILMIAKGALLLGSVSNAESSNEILGCVFGTASYASLVFKVDDYAPIVLSALSTGINAARNPTPEGIASYVATNTFSIANNLLAAAMLNRRRGEFEVLVAIRDTLDAYYLSCGEFQDIERRLGISDSSTGCSSDKLTCATVKYMSKMGFAEDRLEAGDVINTVLRGVNTSYRVISR